MEQELLAAFRRVQARLRDRVVAATERASIEAMSQVAHDEEGDTIFAVDRVSETALVDLFAEEVAPLTSFVLVAEGVGEVAWPVGIHPHDAAWRIIVDPIDGTRGLMYQKRSAWVLTGAAPNHGAETTLADITVAVQTEIPVLKQHLSDAVWTTPTEVGAERFDRISGMRTPLRLVPSQAGTIEGGFAMLARFFPGARGRLGDIDDQIVREAVGPIRRGKAWCFEDQYISTGGQLYELMAGHDRFIADLRPLMEPVLAARGEALGLCCHPYDICTESIARRLGVEIITPDGAPLTCRIDLESDVAWVGYANPRIRAQMEPVLRRALQPET